MAEAGAALRNVALDDKYDLSKDRIFITGTQAVIRLLLMQRERDRLAGLNTAGFVSGYRGSPIGGLDQNLLRAKKWLEPANIVFQPGLNEELAATAVWGAQQAEMRGDGSYDGVFGVWYGKGPGVDRSGDVFRHANMAGSSKHGGVLALMGDDHTAESSTVAHQSEFHFVDVMIPILNPAGVQEILDYGLYGFAMSRFSGAWVVLQVRQGQHRVDRLRGRLAGPGEDRHPDDFACRRRPQHPHPRRHPRPGGRASRLQARRHARLRCGRTSSTTSCSPAGAHRRSASSRWANPTSTCARRSTSSAWTRSRRTTWACASTRSPALALVAAGVGGGSPPASTSSWWWRRSGR
jgi:hypothetical protein